MKNKILVSFSGGRTSAYMAIKLVEKYRDVKEIKVVFANTGREHEKTLDFVDQCSKAFDLNVVWLEAVPLPKGEGVYPKIVTHETADRNGLVFEAAVAKNGIFNIQNRGCTDRMKVQPIHKYMRSIGWSHNDYSTAVGIRADEVDRVSPTAIKRYNAIYPLADWGVRKSDILRFWGEQDFDLEIPEHYGNCVTCWKKSDRKLMTIALERPHWFNFNKKLEGIYTNLHGEKTQSFRGYKTAVDVILEANNKNFKPFVESHQWEFDLNLDVGGGCGESCEMFSDED